MIIGDQINSDQFYKNYLRDPYKFLNLISGSGEQQNGKSRKKDSISNMYNFVSYKNWKSVISDFKKPIHALNSNDIAAETRELRNYADLEYSNLNSEIDYLLFN